MAPNRSELAEPTREKARYQIAVPMIIELRNGLFRQADRVEAFLVNLSSGGAALVTAPDTRLKVKKRYRVAVDDHAGIIEIRNISTGDDGSARLGVQFSRLGLELQELVDDSLDAAKTASTRLGSRAGL